jgi:predicted signal transduction protein with EAL and GGDEF domain
MAADALIDTLPELVVVLRRDGVILSLSAGQGMALRPARGAAQDCAGKPLEAVWPESLATLLVQLTRKAIAQRAPVEARFQESGRNYDARVSAQGPDRAVCVIRDMLAASSAEALDLTDERRAPRLDRRGFLRRFRESVSLALLRERPVSVAVIYVDGIADISELIDTQLSEEIMDTAILRLAGLASAADTASPRCHLGQLSDTCLSLLVESADRDAVGACVREVCANLREPLSIRASTFQLTPYAGVAVMTHTAVAAQTLLARAHSAAGEARRSGAEQVLFFSDGASLEPLTQFDISRELQAAIGSQDIRLRFVPRHDLSSGALVAQVGYLRWMHPLRGEIRPLQLLRMAEATGLATALSRAALGCLRAEATALRARWGGNVRISFGALRSHILHGDFVDDIGRLLAEGVLPAGALELRIAEKTFIGCDAAALETLSRMGVQLVVDEVARGMGSLDYLARSPLWGLQLDRAWVSALRSDPVALKVCRAGVAMATALGLTSIATGVDDSAQRDVLLELGCRYGSGDLYCTEAEDPTAA